MRFYKDGSTRRLKTKLKRRFGKVAVVRVHSHFGAEFEMAFDLDEGHDLAQFLLAVGKELEYEPEVADWMSRILREGSTFVDAGSNNGYFSIMASKIVGPAGRVYAFEPNPVAYGRLLRNRDLNAAVNCFPRMEALGDHAGEVRVMVDSLDDGLSQVKEVPSHLRIDEPAGVPMSRLDQIRIEAAPSLIKVDVEGYEVHALRGMEGLLHNNRSVVLIVEWNPSFGTKDLFDYLQTRYRLYRCLDPGSNHNSTEVTGSRHLPHCNLLCIPRDLPSPSAVLATGPSSGLA